MNYSAYRIVTVIGLAFVVVVIGGAALSISLGLGIVALLILTPLAFFGGWFYLSLIEDRLDEYGGQIPMANAGLGVLGVNIVDESRDMVLGDPDDSTGSDYDSNELETPDGTLHCPFCHAELADDDAKFCSRCGRTLAASSQSKPDPPPSA
jgi:hypothetical protein